MTHRYPRRFGLKLAASSLGLLSAWIVAAVIACGHGASAGKAAGGRTSECRANDDCVLVPEDCCPCHEGGKQRAIARKARAAYEKARQQRCADTACMEMISQDPSCAATPVCKAGRCELAPPPPRGPSE